MAAAPATETLKISATCHESMISFLGSESIKCIRVMHFKHFCLRILL